MTDPTPPRDPYYPIGAAVIVTVGKGQHPATVTGRDYDPKLEAWVYTLDLGFLSEVKTVESAIRLAPPRLSK